MKSFIKQFIPPILLRGQRKIRKIFSYEKIESDNQRSLKLSDATYQVDFKRVEIESEVYFVPVYAMHRPACQTILAGRYYEPLTHVLIQRLLEARPGNLIHAGTFFGDMLPSFSKKCSGIVYAFEPVLENYLLAKLCVQQNNLANILLWNAGLGNELSVAHINTVGEADIHNGGGSQIGSVGQITTLMCLDSLGLQDVSVVQLDVEGFELESLKGAVRIIETCKPTILIEDNSNNCEPFLRDIGYLHIGDVPGLKVWSDVQNASVSKDIMQKL